MAIIEMQKVRLFGLTTQKDEIIKILSKTNSIELKDVDEIKNTSAVFDATKQIELSKKLAKIKTCIDYLEDAIAQSKVSAETKAKILKENFEVTYQVFENFNEKIEALNLIVNNVELLVDQLYANSNNRSKIQSKILQIESYLGLKEKFSNFKNTQTTTIVMGQIPRLAVNEIEKLKEKFLLTVFEVINGETTILKVYSHNSESAKVLEAINEIGFSKCNYTFDSSPSELKKSYLAEILEFEKDNVAIYQKLFELAKGLKDVKVYYDYVNYQLELLNCTKGFKQTQKTFVLEGYVPKNFKINIENAVLQFTNAVVIEFLPLEDGDIPPTLIKNNKVIENFEFITNMYSPPQYYEIDPNFFIAFFFSIFFGFVMADIGYGIILFVACLLIAKKYKSNKSLYQLFNVISIGGVFTIIFGLMFGSFFGVTNAGLSIIPISIMPDPVKDTMTLLIVCLGAGVFQIMVSFALKGVLLLKKKLIARAIFQAFIWDIFFIGVALFALDFLGVTSGLKLVGAGIAGGAVVVAMFTAGIGEKGFNKFSKGFGAVYGIINIFSDILSYARLFGLMLSGSIISQIFNQLAGGLMTGIVGYFVGAIVLVIGHAFNLAMGALGAYIHVARLQYIEFFSRFYTGEGELFTPLGSNFRYINLIKNKKEVL